ncbi:MAG: MOSC N-terminal beta barrel domain-containing protein [Ilumatobacteraceae bacterium]
MSVQRVVELWRYPVKSMQGERLTEAQVDECGITGDRQWAVVDLDTGLGLTAKREPRLLFASARVVEAGAGIDVAITLPDGVTVTGESQASTVLEDWLGRPVELRRASPEVAPTFEIAADFEAEHDSQLFQWSGAPGTFHDSTKTRLSFAALAEMRDWAPRRFRMNVLLSGPSSRPLVGHHVAVGSVEVDFTKHIDRCIIVTRPQPADVERNLDVLRTINTEMSGELGAGSMISRVGRIAIDDELVVLP